MSLSYYYSLLQEKKRQLSRLQSCNSQLLGNQQEFSHYKSTVTKPELSSTTWQGTLASQFEDIRTDRILNSFQDIESNQFSDVFSSLNSKMQLIRQEISSIQQTIAYLEAEAEREKNDK
ncbi:YwqH-like family protein [Cytobacillus purgationiresistens]|uniref:DUF5082 domain-containing protein n=1 Tax=Cytobacillus purgationiresistens TaxID=863449 RepID=A0ABU0ARD2_9BACI|nr:DUF5082 family protein [Cytobacillus purgationiresistens]MDQ0273321.1 hypothetical protein [Cytobacillus purgationiresistens]